MKAFWHLPFNPMSQIKLAHTMRCRSNETQDKGNKMLKWLIGPATFCRLSKQMKNPGVTTFLYFVVTYLRIFLSARYSFNMSSKVGRMLFSFSYACRAT
jgi:hypothetical protein